MGDITPFAHQLTILKLVLSSEKTLHLHLLNLATRACRCADFYLLGPL